MKEVIYTTTEGRKPRGRPRKKWKDNIKQDMHYLNVTPWEQTSLEGNYTLSSLDGYILSKRRSIFSGSWAGSGSTSSKYFRGKGKTTLGEKWLWGSNSLKSHQCCWFCTLQHTALFNVHRSSLLTCCWKLGRGSRGQNNVGVHTPFPPLELPLLVLGPLVILIFKWIYIYEYRRKK